MHPIANITRYKRAPGTQPHRQDLAELEPPWDELDLAELEPPWDELDAGVRTLVRVLHLAGFHPCDSGDGVSKVDKDGWLPDCALDYPHVFMVVSDVRDMVHEADRLQLLLARLAVFPEWPGKHEGIRIEATYNPTDGVGILALTGMLDSDLPAEITRMTWQLPALGAEAKP
jgi:hypothetical protein